MKKKLKKENENEEEKLLQLFSKFPQKKYICKAQKEIIPQIPKLRLNPFLQRTYLLIKNK
ncbi:MAG: hypothetical protein MJZ01_07585 [Bacteroidales bacterium]|nr:hypothetical protein [Bacteroidales bacterium]